MHPEVQASMRKAEQWSPLAIRQSIQRVWPGAVVHRVEDETHPACMLLDRTCGIDWLIEYQGFVKGLSIRCQKFDDYRYCLRKWNSPTFTIRNLRVGAGYTAQSELEKTIAAEQSGAITAAYQLHAYMNVNSGPATEVIAWGLARRVALFKWVKENETLCESRSTTDSARKQRQIFIAVPFSVLPPGILYRSYPDDFATHDQARDEDESFEDDAILLDALQQEALYFYNVD